MINLCRICCQKNALFYKSQCVYRDILHNPNSLHLKTAFCTVALMTVYSAVCLLVLADSGTAGVKDKVD